MPAAFDLGVFSDELARRRYDALQPGAAHRDPNRSHLGGHSKPDIGNEFLPFCDHVQSLYVGLDLYRLLIQRRTARKGFISNRPVC